MNKQEIIILWKQFWIQRDNVERIIQKITGLSKKDLFLQEEISISDIDMEKITQYFKKLNFGYPLEYVLESAEFYWLDLYVDKRCLIPRDDTEVMVDNALKIIDTLEWKILYIDVWTWSWAIASSILSNTKDLWKTSLWLDISDDALDVAIININNYKLEGKIALFKSDLLSTVIDKKLYTDTDSIVITANLPYIKDEDYWNMDKEVILHEPSIALYWWKNTWFEMYERLIWEVQTIKKLWNIAKVIVFIEIGFDQKEVAQNFLDKQKLLYKIHCDNSWVDRCVEISI